MTSVTSSKSTGTNKEIVIDANTCKETYGVILWDKICGYDDHDHPSVKEIVVTGLEGSLSDYNVKKIITAAADLYLKLRNVAHTYQKPNDESFYASRVTAYNNALKAFEAAKKETGLTATSNPSLDYLSKYVTDKHPNEGSLLDMRDQLMLSSSNS